MTIIFRFRHSLQNQLTIESKTKRGCCKTIQKNRGATASFLLKTMAKTDKMLKTAKM